MSAASFAKSSSPRSKGISPTHRFPRGVPEFLQFGRGHVEALSRRHAGMDASSANIAPRVRSALAWGLRRCARVVRSRTGNLWRPLSPLYSSLA